jgi:hypothetical protein
MGTALSPIIRWTQRSSIILTFCCVVYIIFYLCTQDNFTPPTGVASGRSILNPALVLDLKPYDVTNARDVFSPAPAGSATAGMVEDTSAQLPSYLKIVGIVIGHPSQLIVEDKLVNQTYFIQEGSPHAGIKIVKASRKQMIIDYQGQDISLAVHRD